MKRFNSALLITFACLTISTSGSVLISNASDESILSEIDETAVEPAFAEEEASAIENMFSENEIVLEEETAAADADQILLELSDISLDNSRPEQQESDIFSDNLAVETEAVPEISQVSDDFDLNRNSEGIMPVEESQDELQAQEAVDSAENTEIPADTGENAEEFQEADSHENLDTAEDTPEQIEQDITESVSITEEFNNYGISLLANENNYTVDITVTYQQTMARSMFDMINEFRTGSDAWYWSPDDSEKIYCEDLPELSYNYDLEAMAMQRAAEIALNFSHTRPNGETCFSIYNEYGYRYSAVSENIAAGSSLNAESAFNSWKEENYYYNSQGHRRAMLSDLYTAVGIGCVYYNGIYFWVQEFAYPSSSAAETPANDIATNVYIEVADSMIKSAVPALSVDSLDLLIGSTIELPSLTVALVLQETSGSTPNVNVDYTWEVEDSSCAEISGDQLAAKSVGSTVLKTTVMNIEAEIPVSVTQSISDCNVSYEPESFTYDGSEKKPTVTVTDDSTVLTEGVDYTLSYENNINAGAAQLFVTGAGNYSGTSVYDFIVVPADIADAAVSLSQDSYTYNGSEIKPDVILTNGSATLTNGSDYTIAYIDNINAGIASITITGIGNYTGERAETFTIEKAAQTLTAEAASSSISVGETTAITANGEGTISYSSSDTSVASVSSSGVVTGNAAGTATITVNAAGNSNYIAAGITLEIKVTEIPLSGTSAKSISDCTLKLSEKTFYYDGTKKKPTVTVKDGSAKLKKGTDYTVSYSNNKNIGTATVTVTGQGNYTGTASANFKITVEKGAGYVAGDFIVSITKASINGNGKVKIMGLADYSLTKVTIPATLKIGGVKFKVTSITAKAFKGNTNLKSASIGSNVTTIGNGAFRGCRNMTKVTIKKNVKTIGKNAFCNCRSLKTITIKSEVLSSVGSNAFKGIKSKAVITVPVSKLSDYEQLLKDKGQGSKVTITI